MFCCITSTLLVMMIITSRVLVIEYDILVTLYIGAQLFYYIASYNFHLNFIMELSVHSSSAVPDAKKNPYH